MRIKLLVALLGLALVAAAIVPLNRSRAARNLQQGGNNPLGRALPNYDVRLEGRNEFIDYELTTPSGKQLAMQSEKARSRASAVDGFRASIRADLADNVRAVANETGAMKNFFIDGAAFTAAQSGTADNIARGFLKQHPGLFAIESGDVDKLKMVNEDNDRGTHFLEYAQTVGGIKVFEGQVQVVVNPNGEVLSVREGFLVTDQPVDLKSSIPVEQAIARAFTYSGRKVKPSFIETTARTEDGETTRFANPLGAELEDVSAELNVLRIGDEARLAYHIFAEVGPEEWYELLVDAQNGKLLLRSNLYVDAAQGTVYTESPNAGPRQLVSFVGDTVINTSFGWMGTSTVTTGNNVEAYLDTNADNLPDTNNGTGLSNGHAFASNQDFTFPFSTTVDPRTQQAAVVTNLFYYNNIMHDFSYALGFTETARNFQTNNYGRGGTGNDSVRAEAQDGSGTNNANFATPPDGSRPRMQQYLFTSPSPDRDSSIDGDVVFHEYGHGISNRLIGNGSTALRARSRARWVKVGLTIGPSPSTATARSASM